WTAKISRFVGPRPAVDKPVGPHGLLPGCRWPPYGLHSNRDDRRESGACVLRPLRSRQRTTLDARDSTHRLGQPGPIPPRHVMAGDPQGWKSHHAVDDQRLELPTAVRARPPRGGESDEG